MRLFLAGYETGFKLTDSRGRPTKTLYTMVSLLEPYRPWGREEPDDPPEIVRFEDLPENERRAFSRVPRRKKRDGTFEAVSPVWLASPGKWYIRNITSRIKYCSYLFGGWDWVVDLFPNLRSMMVCYHEDGKRRYRTVYLHECQPNWRLNNGVYFGLYRWNYDHCYRHRDSHTLLRHLLDEQAAHQTE